MISRTEQGHYAMSNAVDLSSYSNGPNYSKGRSFFVRAIWFLVNAIVLQNPLNPSSSSRVAAMRIFGAKIGSSVIVKPGVNVKHPWSLSVGDNSWIGENAWIDNTYAPVWIGANVCVSQGTYLCTGNHDWTDPSFGLIAKDLVIEDGVWIGARACVLAGARLASHSIITTGSVIAKPTDAYGIYAGIPAVYVKTRVIK